jgi:CheY-like chemotaxis protein/nitrogen-specific signal transduction histidine kinase
MMNEKEKSSNKLEVKLKLLEARNQQLTSALKRVEESISLTNAFLSDISHEIRTPLNAIMGFTELLERKELTLPKRIQYSRTIRNSANDLLKIISDIIDISKLTSGRLQLKEEPGYLSVLLDNLFKQFQSKNDHIIKKDIKLIITNTLNHAQDKVIIDFQRLQQIFVHLIENAYKFTENGSIEVHCSLKNPETLKFYVKDSGIGIPQDKLKSLFNHRFQIDDIIINNRENGCRGLGLFIAKKLVELMHGEIWVDSTEGIGSVFYFTIPYESLNELNIQVEEEEYHLNWQNKTIMVVEDMDYNAAYIEEILSKTKVKLLFASDGASAIELFTMHPEIDVVLMDIRLPDANGIELTQKMKSKRNDIKIIAQTAYASEEDRQACIQAGCDDYLSKPLGKETLMQTISNFLV